MKMSSIKRARSGLLTAVTAITVALLATAANAQGKGETVRIQDYPGVSNLPIRVAIEKGYCANHGIKCELQMIASGPLGIQAMLAKSIEGALTVPEVSVPAILKGAKMKTVVNIYSKNVGLIMVGNQVETPNAGKPFPAWVMDMKGKKIGVTARGSGAETAVRFMLLQAGLTADDVTFVAVGSPATTFPALTNKQVDFAFSFEPVGTMCDLTKQCKTIWRGDVDPQPAEIFATNGGGAGIILTQAYIDANPHVVEAVISATQDADKLINDPANFEEVLRIGEKYFKFETTGGDQLMRALLQRTIKVGAFSPHVDRAAMKASADFLLQTGQWEKSVDVSEIVDPRAP